MWYNFKTNNKCHAIKLRGFTSKQTDDIIAKYYDKRIWDLEVNSPLTDWASLGVRDQSMQNCRMNLNPNFVHKD